MNKTRKDIKNNLFWLRTGFTPQEKKLSPVPHVKRFFEQEKAKKPSAYQTRQ
jgi:hypothetical protein